MKNNLLKAALAVFAFGLLAVIPLNSSLTFGYGSSTAECSKVKPDKAVLYEPNHPLLPRASGAGEVRLNWLKTSRADRYTIGYGVASGNYIYGVANTGDVTNYTVGYLSPGRKYYFAVRAVNDCMPGDWSQEWAVTAGGRGSAVTLANNNVNNFGTNSNVVPSVQPQRRAVGQPVGGTTVSPVLERRQPTVPAATVPAVQVNEPAPGNQGIFGWIANFFTSLFGGK